MYGGYENDPVLAERTKEYDRNLADYLRQRPPTWQNRAEYERELATLPGAGAEILGHIQQRAVENMPTELRREWEQSEASRQATMKAITAATANEAAFRHFETTADAKDVAAFKEHYERTPEGWKPVRMTPWEKMQAMREQFYTALKDRPEEIAKFEKEFMATPDGFKRRQAPGYIFGSGAQAAAAGFVSEAERAGPVTDDGRQTTDRMPPGQAGSVERGGPAVGTVRGGYVFIGGNPADQNSWTPIKQ
jgi:hypothetical protein